MDLQGPPSERTQTEKLWDLKMRAQQYARDQGCYGRSTVVSDLDGWGFVLNV
jgi:hypothetical protein